MADDLPSNAETFANLARINATDAARYRNEGNLLLAAESAERARRYAEESARLRKIEGNE